MLEFTVPGDPVAKGRPRISSANGFVRAYTPAKTRDYELMVANLGKIAMTGRSELLGPLKLTLWVYLKIPKSWSKKKAEAAYEGSLYPTTKPDLDNIVKAVSDALNLIVYHDDSQIVDLVVRKRYSLNPCVVVNVSPV